MTTVDIVVVAVVGFFGPAVSALGAGGALITFLGLIWAGVPPQMANATNLLTMPLAFLGGAKILKEEPLPRSFTLAAVVGTAGGVSLAHILDPAQFSALVPWLVYGAAALLLIEPLARSRRAGKYLASLVTERPRWVTAGLLVFTSAYAGFFGAAVGTLVIVALSCTMTFGGDLTIPNRMKLALCLITSFVGAIGFGLVYVLTDTQLVHPTAALVLILPTIAGGLLGAKMINHVSTGKLRAGMAAIAGGGATWLLMLL